MNQQHEFIINRFGENCRIRYNKTHNWQKNPATIKEHTNRSTENIYARKVQDDELIIDIGDETLNKLNLKKKTLTIEQAKETWPALKEEAIKVITFLKQESIPYWLGFQGRGFHINVFFKGESVPTTFPALRHFKQAIIKWIKDNTGADVCLDVNNKAIVMIRAYGSQDDKKCLFTSKKCYLKEIPEDYPLKEVQAEFIEYPPSITYWNIKTILVQQFKESKKKERVNDYWGSQELGISPQELLNSVNYIKICEKLVNESPLYYDRSGLWWTWNQYENKYEMIDEVDILNQINKALNWSGIINSNYKNQFITALKMAARERNLKEVPKTWVQFKDKIINYETGEEYEPSPEYFLTNPIPWDYGLNDETLMIDELFASWVGIENKEILYEIIAYSLLKDYPLQRLFILYGSGGNGKGQFLGLIKKFLGTGNCTSTDLDLIGKNRFESAKLLNKLACFISETNVTILRYTSTIKKLVGGDLTGGEFKNKTPFDFVNYAKLIMASNSIPITFDRTYGFYRRMNIIEFNSKFSDGKDIINNIPEIEYNNLCNKCMSKLRELLERGEFINDGNVAERKEHYEKLSNPIITFIDGNYDRSLNDYVIKADFVEKLKNWLDVNGFRMMNNREITSALKSMGFEDKVNKVKSASVRCIFGLSGKVTAVTEVTRIPTLFSHIGNKIGISVTGITSVTKIKDEILSIISSGMVNSDQRNLILKVVCTRLKCEQKEVLDVLKYMCRDGILYEPKDGIYKIVNNNPLMDNKSNGV